jgi:predicted Na+-dependent transporter
MDHTPLQRALQDVSSSEATSMSPAESTHKNILVLLLPNVLLFMLIFGLSATVDVRRIKQQLRNCRAISIGLVMQFAIMPLLGFMAVITLKNYGLTAPMGITLLVVTSSPGGSYSNFWCSLFNADLALSVAMTALSTLVSMAALPANLLMYAHFAYRFDVDQEKDVLASVDFTKLLISLGIVIGAVLTGLYASYKFNSTKFKRAVNIGGTISGILLIIASAVFSTSGESDAKPWNQHWSFYIGVGLPCIAGLALAHFAAMLARLKNPEVVTLGIECSYQNTGIATSAVLTMFDDPTEIAQAMAVPLFYGIAEMGAILVYCLISWKLNWTNAPPKERLCVILSKTYDIGENEDDDLTTLQGSSVDPFDKDKELENGNRDRINTLLSEDTIPMLENGIDQPKQNQVLRNRASSPNRPNDNDNQNRSRPVFPIREESENIQRDNSWTI